VLARVAQHAEKVANERMDAVGTDKRAQRIAEVIDVNYSKALEIWRSNEGLRLTLNRHSTDEDVREALRRDGLTQYLR